LAADAELFCSQQTINRVGYILATVFSLQRVGKTMDEMPRGFMLLISCYELGHQRPAVYTTLGATPVPFIGSYDISDTTLAIPCPSGTMLTSWSILHTHLRLSSYALTDTISARQSRCKTARLATDDESNHGNNPDRNKCSSATSTSIMPMFSAPMPD